MPELMCLEDTELIDIMVQNRKTRLKRRKGRRQGESEGKTEERKRINSNQRGEKTHAAAFVFL